MECTPVEEKIKISNDLRISCRQVRLCPESADVRRIQLEFRSNQNENFISVFTSLHIVDVDIFLIQIHKIIVHTVKNVNLRDIN